MLRPRTTGAKLALLSLLYLAEGLPFGFQARALPLYLREHGVSITLIGFSSALSLPWALKFLWAPLVDRWGSTRFGRRKSWILPTQLGLAACAAAAAVTPLEGSLLLLAAVVLVMNLLAATQDIAVDGLAVDLLDERDLGAGNSAQVGGYKVGMLLSGGLLVWAAGEAGWAVVFGGIAVLTLIAAAVTLFVEEPPRSSPAAPSFAAIWQAAVAIVRLPGTALVVAVIASYKFGESLTDAMWKQFLLGEHYTRGQLGLWLGTYGAVASIAGSLAGGLLTTRAGLATGLRATACARVIPLALMAALALGHPSATTVIAAGCAEEFFGGALTTAMFAYMMSTVDRTIGATHFTLLASIEIGGKALAALPAGALALALGYPALFALGAALSLAFLPLAWRARRA